MTKRDRTRRKPSSQDYDKVDHTVRRYDKTHCAGKGHDEEPSYARYRTGRKSDS